MSNLSSVLEAYVGRTKELIKCEGYIREIIDLINEERSSLIEKGPINNKRKVYRDAEPCRRLEEELTKFFKVAQIKIYWGVNSPNGGTFPTSRIIICKNRMTNDFSKTKIIVMMEESLIYHAKLNEKEVMGILLHEIGHNFYYSPIMIAQELVDVVRTPIGTIYKILGKGVINIGLTGFDHIVKHIPLLANIANIVGDLSTEYRQFTKVYKSFDNIVTLINNLRLNLTNPIYTLGGYGNERGADSFAAKYGYGPDLSTAMRKLDTLKGSMSTQILNNLGPLNSFANDMAELTNDLINLIMMDVHPNDNQRASSVLKKLERDLKKGDYPPEVKEDLENEIKRMKQVYETVLENESNVNVRKTWYHIIDHITRGHSDIRELFSPFFERYEF